MEKVYTVYCKYVQYVQLYFGDVKNENVGELNICGKAVQGKKTIVRKDDSTTFA
jgi:hypothetical protein